MRVAQILGAALVLLGCCSAANAPAKKGVKSGEQQQDDLSRNCSAKHRDIA
jgi:PBP1b-binding outer membrane lipoprotein LpoB